MGNLKIGIETIKNADDVMLMAWKDEETLQDILYQLAETGENYRMKSI